MKSIRKISQEFCESSNNIFFELISDFSKLRKDFLFIFVISLGSLIRLIYLSQPIKGDETATFLSYIEPINPLRVFVYTYTNNHILHTILVKISTFFFGNTLFALRVPSFLASIGIICFTYAICKRLRQNGIFAAICLSTWPYLIAYATNSRGYSLFCLLALFLVYIYLIARLNLDNYKLIIFSIVCALGIYTIPTFVIIVFAICSFISIDQFFILSKPKKSIFEIDILLVFFTFIFSSILYLPVFLLSPSSILNNKITRDSLPWDSYVNEIGIHIKNSIIVLSQILPNFYLYILIILFSVGICDYLTGKKFLGLILFPIILITSLIVITYKLTIPGERTWIFFIPFFLIVVDNGFTRLVIKIKNLKRNFLLLVMIVFSLTITNPFLSNNYIDIEEKAFPESEMAIKYLESKRVFDKKDKLNVSVLSGSSMELNYYNWFHNAKISVNKNRIYNRKGIYESFKSDFKRFLDSEFQTTRDKNDQVDYYIINKRFEFNKDVNLTQDELIKNYPLELIVGYLEIYSTNKMP